jgi:hypothetical protein
MRREGPDRRFSPKIQDEEVRGCNKSRRKECQLQRDLVGHHVAGKLWGGDSLDEAGGFEPGF